MGKRCDCGELLVDVGDVMDGPYCTPSACATRPRPPVTLQQAFQKALTDARYVRADLTVLDILAEAVRAFLCAHQDQRVQYVGRILFVEES